MNNIILVSLTTLLLIAFANCSNQEKVLVKQGNDLISKIEEYESVNGSLPDSLEILGITETLEGPLFYKKVDSINYMIWFCTSLGESMFYYSDTKEWDSRYREMGIE